MAGHVDTPRLALDNCILILLDLSSTQNAHLLTAIVMLAYPKQLDAVFDSAK